MTGSLQESEQAAANRRLAGEIAEGTLMERLGIEFVAAGPERFVARM